MIEPEDYARAIEAYLCRKNDGHLIRIVGPAFEQVSSWARHGIPLNLVYAGVDRYFERYYRRGPRRRPVRIEFCEHDVFDVFDDWRRAVGVPSRGRELQTETRENADDSSDERSAEPTRRRRPSLAAHLEQVLTRLTVLRTASQLPRDLQPTLEDTVRTLDVLRSEAPRARGESRNALLAKLEALDRTLRDGLLNTLDQEARTVAEREASESLAAFRERMPVEAYQRAWFAAVERSIRDRFGVPTITY